MLRPGRFHRILGVPPPDAKASKEILKIHAAKKPLDPLVSLDKLVELIDGLTGIDIAALIDTAAMAGIKEQITAGKKGKLKVTMLHFENAAQKVNRKNKVARDALV